MVQRLLGPDVPYAPLELERVDLEEVVIDFTSLTSLEGIRVSGADYELTPDGLVLSPIAADPQLVIARDDLRANFVRIEMNAAETGALQVFWSPPGLPFARKRQRGARVPASEQVRAIEVDLSAEVGLGSAVHHLRIDPIDRRTRVAIRTITLLRVGYLPRGSGSGQATLGTETRQAVGLRAGQQLARAIHGGHDARMIFGLGGLGGNETPVTVRLDVTAGGRTHTVFEERFDPAVLSGWVDREADLGQCPRRGCEVALAVGADGGSELAGAVLVSNPVVISGGGSRLPNVILISLDTLGAKHVSAYGAAPGITPHLEALGRRGVVFENAFAQSSLTHTSHASLLTGSAPLATGFYWLDGDVGQESTLGDVLRSNGYVTAAFTGGVVLVERLGFDKGFDTYYRHDTLFRPIADHSDAEILAGRALSWVESRGAAPFFLFLHTYEVHGPHVRRDGGAGVEGRHYRATHMRGRLPVAASELEGLVHVLTPDGEEVVHAQSGRPALKVDELRAAYHSEIEYVDSVIGGLLEALERGGALDDAIVVLTADHGEAFFEHGLVEHGLLYDENLRVPLLIHAAGRLPAGRRVPQQVSAIDVVPTILDLAGLTPSERVDGTSLVALARGDSAADRPFYSLVLGNGLSFQAGARHKLILRAAIGQENFGADELFDLAADPGEKRNLLHDGVPPPRGLATWARRTIEEIPGVHVDLSALAGSTWELEIPFGTRYRDRVLAFDVERLSPAGDDPETLRAVVELAETSLLVVRDRSPTRKYAVHLRSREGDRALRFVFVPPVLAGREHGVKVRSDPAGLALPVWRVNAAADSGRGFLPEEEEKLRALGYVQ